MKPQYKIKVVNTPQDYKAFVTFPFKLYKDNPYWVPPLIKEELATLNPTVNPVYKNASAQFFLAYKGTEIVGRVGALVNWLEVNELKKRKVRFGWFDVIDDPKVTALLMQEVEAFG
ncbi:MAG: GTP cyclohydrolase, partial [Flavobacteriaceae bacterium]